MLICIKRHRLERNWGDVRTLDLLQLLRLRSPELQARLSGK